MNADAKGTPEWPSICDNCGAHVDSDAEAFLHAAVHATPWQPNAMTLRKLPFSLFPAVARVMEEYKRSV